MTFDFDAAKTTLAALQEAVRQARRGDQADNWLALSVQMAEHAPGLVATLTEAQSVLTSVQTYLAVEHNIRKLHDNLGVNLGCSGCELLARVEATLWADR